MIEEILQDMGATEEQAKELVQVPILDFVRWILTEAQCSNL